MTQEQGNTRTVSAIAVVDMALGFIELGAVSLSDIGHAIPELHRLLQGFMLTKSKTGGGIEGETGIEELRLDEESLILLWQVVNSRSEQAALGVLLGQRINEKAKGFLANWVAQCSNLREACDIFINNIRFLNPSEQWEIHEHNNTMSFCFSFADSRYPQIAVERSMSKAVAWSAYLSQQTINVLSATFTAPRPDNIEVYERVFGCRLEFNSALNSISMDAKVGEYRIPSSSAYLKKMLTEKAQELQKRFPDNLTSIVYGLLASKPAQFNHIAVICDLMHMSRSTLYRQLKRERSSYSVILDQVRREAAESLKAEGVKDASIAVEIGFKDTASYYKARKRWYAQGIDKA